MHDPMTLAWTIKRPWPKVSRRRYAKPKRNRRTLFRHLGPWELYWPSIVDCWHVEPGGNDSGDVCKHYRPVDEVPAWKVRLLPWFRHGRKDDGTPATYVWDRSWARTHWRHWSIRFIPWRTFLRWRYSRCAECKGRFRWHESPTSHQWDGAGPSRKGEPGVFHGACSSVISLRRTISTEREAIVALFHATRVAADLSEEEQIARLHVHKLTPDFTHNHHVTHSILTALGWSFDHDYNADELDGAYRLKNVDGRTVEPYALATAKGWR
jgi:hypothetical protein